MKILTVHVSGVAYYAALDPRATGVPKELGLPEPKLWKKIGRGHQVHYDVTFEQADEIVEHFETLGVGFTTGSDDLDTRAEGRELLRAASSLRKQIEEARRLQEALDAPADDGSGR